MQRAVQQINNPAEDEEVRRGVPDQDCPQEILRVLQVPVQQPGRRPARPHLLADANAAQRKHAGFHSGQDKGLCQTAHEDEPDQKIVVHLTTSTSSSCTRRSSVACAVSFNPRNTVESPAAGTTSSRLINSPFMVSTSATSPRV